MSVGKLEIGNPSNYIYVLIPVLILVMLVLALVKKRRILNQLRIDIIARFGITRLILIACGMLLIFFALLGPRKLDGYTEIKTKGLDIYVLIDTSNSMLTQDVYPDRISRAKRIVDNLMNYLPGDRIGFIPFSSDAYIQMPLTNDYNMARLFLDVVDTRMVGSGGTDFGPALRLAQKSFDDVYSSDKVIIILSDGEEHKMNSVDVLRQINDSQLKVFTIGVGTLEGGKIPIYDYYDTEIIDYITDENYDDVISKLEPDLLERIAAEGGGKFYESTVSGIEADYLMEDILKLKRDATNMRRINTYRQLFQYFLGFGILLILVAYLLPETRRLK